MYLLSLLLPTTKGQEGEGLLQYISSIGVSKCWRGQSGGLVKVSSNFELVRYRYDDEYMHDAKC
jgi:hypothetical protein